MPGHSPDLTSLRLLVAVGDLGSLGRAARAEGISQPAASKRIAILERDLGIQLMIRSAGGSLLTTEGRVAADWARRVLDNIERMLGAVASLRAGAASDLHVAASMTIAEHLVPVWLFELRSAHPALHVGLRVANSEQVQELVLNGGADIGFVESPSIDNRLASRQVATDRLAVVVAPGHPWSRRTRPLRRDQLLTTPLVVRERGSGTRATLDRVLKDDDRSKPLLELGSNQAVKGAVIAGAGAAVLSILAVKTELDTGRLVELKVDGADLRRRLSAVWPRDSQLSDPSKWLLRTAARSKVEAQAQLLH
jgi:DNA-binding transcriptional LysR family regulator